MFKIKSLMLVILCVVTCKLSAQDKDTITMIISDRYSAKIVSTANDGYYNSGTIAIYDKQTNKILLEQESSALPTQFDDLSINILELPYGRQSLVQYSDFNFDGIPDLAIQDGNNSCYGGPSYEVYLADGKGDFKHSAGFSALAQEYCGFFGVDYDKKLINTMTKSGCCWHWFYTFDVYNNEPRMLEEVEEGLNNVLPFVVDYKTSRYKNDTLTVVENFSELYLEDDTSVIFSFELPAKKKKVMLIEYNDDLFYVFLNNKLNLDSSIEFIYPSQSAYNDCQDNDDWQKLACPTFVFSQSDAQQTLSFGNQSARYQLYSGVDKVGIRVTTGGKVYDMMGDVSTRSNMDILPDKKVHHFDNLRVE